MEPTNQFQAVDYLKITESLSNKDWMLKLSKEFPIGEIFNCARVLQLEQVNALELEQQKPVLKRMLSEMAQELEEQKALIAAKEAQDSEFTRPRKFEPRTDPIKLSF